MAKKKAQKRKLSRKGLIVIHSPAQANLEVSVASEMADDEMIEKELMGEILPYFVYQFTPSGEDGGGKPVSGLTVKGVNEVVRRMSRNPKSGSKIRINPDSLKKEEVERNGEKGIEVSVLAEDLVTGNSAFGLKFEPYMKNGKRGKYTNTFAVEKALAKAERNAKRKLIPEVLATKMIETLISGNPNNVRQLAAPKPQPKREATPEEIFELTQNMIRAAKSTGPLMVILERVKESKKLSKPQKTELEKLIGGKVDSLDA